MKKIVFILLVSLLLTGVLPAQSWKFYRNEVSFGLGASNFLGELGGANSFGTNGVKDLEFSMTRPAIDLRYSYKINPYFKARTSFIYGRLKGDDALTNEFFRNHRNLHFKSPVIEFGASVEYFPLTERIGHMYRMKGVSGKSTQKYSPYLTAGIGIFYFNPKAKSPTSGNWLELQPLGTEGQGLPGGGEKYKRISICIPMGIGVRYAIDKTWSIGFEVTGRMTFTDYIDDVSGKYYDNSDILDARGADAAYFADPNAEAVTTYPSGLIWSPTLPGSQRGDISDNDSYMFAIFSIHYRFLQSRYHLPKF